MPWEDVTSGEEATRDDPMLKEHMAIYHDFVRLVGYSTAATAVTLVLLALILL